MAGLRPFLSYYGGKFRAAPRYPEPTCNTIIEPFAGSAGYSVRYPDRRIMLFDVDERVIGTWQYLIKVSADEIRALPLMESTDHVADLDVPQEARWLIGWWLNKGMTAPCNVPSAWMRDALPGRDATYWGAGVRERIAQQVEYIRHWQAFHSSYADAPDVAATWFIDPPYAGTPGRRYKHSTIDYATLGQWCQAREGQAIVCENTGADWLPFEPFMEAKATAGRGRAGVSREVIWVKPALDMSLGLRLASLDMTASGETKIDSSGDEIRERRAEQQRRVMAAATDYAIIGTETNPALIETALRVALMKLAGEWRDEAAWWDGVKRRGSVGAAKELREAATRVAAFAQGLSAEPPPTLAPTPPRAVGEEPVSELRCGIAEIHDPHRWCGIDEVTFFCDGGDLGDDPTPAKPQPTGDALMDFFTGAVPTYTPPARPEQVLAALPKAEPMVTLSVNTMTTAALGLVDSPFTSPGRPGANRPAVARLGYAALPAVARVLGERDAREHVSHSFVDSYESCSLSALLNDASRAELIGPRRPSWSLVGGNAFHSAVEAIEQVAAAGTVLDKVDASVWEKHLSTQIQDLCADLSGSAYADPSSWHVANGGREGFDWWRVEGAKMLDAYLKHHDAQWRETHRILMIDGKPCLEQPYEMTVRSPDGTTGRTAKGFIDAAWVDLTTSLIVLSDYKTGRSAPATTFQLGEYAHALAMFLEPGSSIHARYWLARRGEYTPQIDPTKAHPLGELQYRYDTAMRGMEAGVFAPHVSNLCVSCGVADYCPARASSES